MATHASIFGLLVLLALGIGGFIFVAMLVFLVTRSRGKSRAFGGVIAAGIAMVVALVAISVVTLFLAVRKPVMTRTTTDSTHTTLTTGQTHVEFGNDSSRIEAIELIPTPAESEGSVPLPTPGIAVAGNPWSTAVEEFQDFEADVYPSLESAAEALGRRVGKRLMEISDTPDSEPQPIYVWRESFDGVVYSHTVTDRDMIISRKVLDAAASGIRQKLENPVYVSVEKAPSGNRSDYAMVNVVFQEVNFDNHNRWGQHAETKTGGLALRVEVSGKPFSVSTRFADTPWVEDRSAFAENFDNGDWLVAYSHGDHTTNEEARQDALVAATESLLPLAKARINLLSASDQHHYEQQMAKNPNWLRERVADELVSRNRVSDRFTQSFARPYGATIWREAILIDASPKRVEAIASSLVQGINSRVTHERSAFFSFVLLAGLVFGTYLFLNMATKGYYAWSLRFAAVGGVAAAVFLVRFLF